MNFEGFNTICLLKTVEEPLSNTSSKYGPDLIIWQPFGTRKKEKRMRERWWDILTTDKTKQNTSKRNKQTDKSKQAKTKQTKNKQTKPNQNLDEHLHDVHLQI